MDLVVDFAKTLLLTSRDLVPIVMLFAFFQLVVIRQPLRRSA